MNQKKKLIIQNINEENCRELSESIPAYIEAYPFDVDMYVIAGFYYLQQNDLDSAEKLLYLSRKHNYYDVDTYYLLGELHFKGRDYIKAMEFYTRAEILYSYYGKKSLFFTPELCVQKLDEVQTALQRYMDLHPNSAEEVKNQLERYIYMADNFFYLISSADEVKLDLGTTVEYPGNEQRFCSCFEPCDLFSSKPKTELLRPIYQGKDYFFSADHPILLPIAPTQPDSDLNITLDSGEAFHKRHIYPNHLNYYRVSEGIHFTSEHEFTVGEPVHLVQKGSLKKLVLSFFIDGLSWQLIREEGLEKVMPNTCRFFSEGLICDNFFTVSDWTYPSLPSYVTGYSVPEHMMVHPQIHHPLPDEGKQLFRAMKEAGYYTAMFNNDPRSSSIYGYTKDIDRYVTQHPVCYRAKRVIPDAIEHIHAFRETNQYLWITIPDLHDIADEVELSLDTIAQIDIVRQQSHEKSATSVKQKYSIDKRLAYIHALQAIDLQFSALYQYIENNFEENEFVVTMFGDHGQTYLIPSGQHHLSRYHSNPGFLVRGSVPCGRSSEYISATDYSHILCELAGTDAFQSPDGHLPKTFGGSSERDFAITETIHPGDPYMAAFHAPTHAFYYTGEHVMTPDMRLEQGGACEIQLTDHAGAPMDDPALIDKYKALIDERLKYIYMY